MFDGFARNNHIEIAVWNRQLMRISLYESGSAFLLEIERSLSANLQSGPRKVEPNRVRTLARESPDKSTPSARNLKRSQSPNIDHALSDPPIPRSRSVIVPGVQLVISGVPGVVFCVEAHSESRGNPICLTEILNPLRSLRVPCGQSVALIVNDLAKDFVEAYGDRPVGIVRAEFGEIRNVADVVALAVFIDVVPVQFLAGHLFNFGDGFEHGNAVRAASTKVIDFARSRIRRKLFYSANYIMTVNIVAHLFPLVAKYRIRCATERYLYQIRQKTVQLHTGMRRARKAATAKHAYLHAEIAAIFLCH